MGKVNPWRLFKMPAKMDKSLVDFYAFKDIKPREKLGNRRGHQEFDNRRRHQFAEMNQ